LIEAFNGRHQLANLVLVAVLLLGGYAYWAMPRAQYPEVQLNWVAVATVWPGASVQDVERQLTLPLEAAVRRIPGVRYVAATSRDHVATLLIRFEDLAEARYERQLQDLAREIQATASAFPKDVRPPQFQELTTSSLFHTALVLVSDPGGTTGLCRLAATVQADIEALDGVGRVWAHGQRARELEVRFDPAAVAERGVDLEDLVRTVAGHARDYPAGSLQMGGRQYAARVTGQGASPDGYAGLQVPAGDGATVPLADLAQVGLRPAPARELVAVGGFPAVLLAVTKQENANTFALLHRLNAYIEQKNGQLGQAALLLADDQTEATRTAIAAMEYNALLGLVMVLAIAWLFLGRRIAFLVCIGIPFALAAMFLALHLGGQTLNVSVLLGVAIVLGIPLDDAVVVAEAISLRINQGVDRLAAVRQGLREVAAPVTASVLATTAAFAPLMLMPGILGEFMLVVPLTVILTLLASLVASLWILPTHVAHCRFCVLGPSRSQQLRLALTRRLRRAYGRGLVAAFRHPGRVGGIFLLVFALVASALALGWLKTQWFLSDPLGVFNVNVRLANHAGLPTTLAATRAVEQRILAAARPGEVRSSYAMAGLQFTPREPLTGDHLGQVTLSLRPDAGRDVQAFVAAARQQVAGVAGVEEVTFQVISADLPTLSGLSVRLSGERQADLLAAAQALRREMAAMAGIRDVSDDAQAGKPQVTLHLNAEAASRAGLDPFRLAGYVRLHHDGVAVAKVADGETEIDVVVRGAAMDQAALQAWLERPLRLPGGRLVKPAELFSVQFDDAAGQLRRVDFRRAVTLQVGLDRERLSAQSAAGQIAAAWQRLGPDYPGVTLAFGGEFEDIKESLTALGRLFALGALLMYLLLAWQFRSASLPLLILATAPMAFAGACLGLLASGLPLSLYTLYGGVALGGVAVNASIMLVAAARDRRRAGFAPLAAAFHAARRRLVPILITSLAIIAGLLSVALGLAGDSVLWGPLAATLVWGLAFATPMTLFATPLLYYRLGSA
jgi:multidrug efflux pump subunit AcrB